MLLRRVSSAKSPKFTKFCFFFIYLFLFIPCISKICPWIKEKYLEAKQKVMIAVYQSKCKVENKKLGRHYTNGLSER